MKIILIYDISSSNNNLNKIRKLCTKYLLHIQFSVFEGELENYELLKLKKNINKIIDTNIDSIIIFKFTSFNDSNKEIIGFNKNDFDGFNI